MLLVLRFKLIALAGVAELVDALDLGSSDASRGGSSPSARTKRFRRLQDDNRRTFCGSDPAEWSVEYTGAALSGASLD